ncbi:ricin-type beta-trefoil lectin domain protein [Streptomyces sp. WI04-05B]|uniref:ricin-type beta-trefoil lectin domain protein n=1 Tax=Streptomyces TaxID=1883 RepID=UPI0029B663C6|nr:MULTISPECIES: ricin-type beta-trefoil lectin domain protein [unclassified Streptomyces]MDX2543128.1 ricin-type beta-trefoil lectin domain protein [Streptomyces sp. WI04-05B]MDX2584831.1 ricin-type beta-trefoil lectin domain protein [Streptomyces sp. WI04-05A]
MASLGLLTAGAAISAPAASAAVSTAALRGADSGRCLDVPGGNTESGTELTLWDCNGGSNQQWSYDTATKTLGVYGSKCLDSASAGAVNGVAVLIRDCTGGATQQWDVVSGGTVRNVGLGLCLDAAELGVANGTPIQLWSCNGGGNQQWSGITPGAPADTTGMTSLEKQALDNVNAQRTANGCAALVVDTSLQKAAHDYAAEMVRTHNFSHTSASGKSPTDRARDAGYTRGGVGENIAMGFQGDPNGVVNNATYGWMSSSGHRANILNCGYTRTGMGYDAGNIDPNYASGSWVQVFG